IRWVKEIFPPRPRCRWLLMTIRLSMSSLAGTTRTLVAVGTLRLAAMFCAVRAAAPRSLLGAAAGAGGGGGAGGPGGGGAGAGRGGLGGLGGLRGRSCHGGGLGGRRLR